MKKELYITIYVVLVLVIAGVTYSVGDAMGYERGYDDGYEIGYADIEIITPTQDEIDFEHAVTNLSRGSLGVPAQWYMMKTLIGWEKMMLIFGYADNRSVCSNMVIMGRDESPGRDFKCLDAN